MSKLCYLLIAVLVSGCAAQQLQNERNRLAGYPEPYKDGYVDGCGSGKRAAGNPYFAFTKDVMRFGSDNLYAQGWGDGFNVCKADYESIMRSLSR